MYFNKILASILRLDTCVYALDFWILVRDFV